MFNSTPNPTVALRAQFSGIFFDALEGAFKPDSVSTGILRTADIGGGAARKVKDQVQQVLEGMSQQWTDVLNIFPQVVREQMIPTLEASNRNLNAAFGKLKFSEGGSRSIAEEIQALTQESGPARFFASLRNTIGTGIGASLNLAGVDFSQEALERSFGQIPDVNNIRKLINQRKLPGLNVPKKEEDTQKFVEAIASFANLTGSLANVSPNGIGRFLTQSDSAFINREIGGILNMTDGRQFSQAVEQLRTKLEPVSQFLTQSVQESTTLFGRGIVAALEAATESQAHSAFMQSLGEGTKEILFRGITEAFIASAQFNDLLAPIQQTIRDFTQEAIATGQTPDLDAFRRSILPHVEGIASRGETLAPLLLELQKLGLDFKDALKIFAAEETKAGPANRAPDARRPDLIGYGHGWNHSTTRRPTWPWPPPITRASSRL